MIPMFNNAEAVIALLRCPACRSVMTCTAHVLRCTSCGRNAPIMQGIPRFVDGDFSADAADRRTQASFGYEWTHFKDWRPSGATFIDYFSNFDLGSLRGQTVLDAGCGMGRHARQIAGCAGTVIAVDFSAAIDQAARNVADQRNVHCIQADLKRLPVADAAFDFVYSMGVLHHINDTTEALRSLVAALKPGGRLRVYLYWKRTGLTGAILSVVSAARAITTRLPHPVLRSLCWLLSVALTAFVIVPYRAARKAGAEVKDTWPLAVYTKYPFTVLYNDQFDRFSAPIEKRYTQREVHQLLTAAGLRNVRVHARYGWLGDGIK